MPPKPFPLQADGGRRVQSGDERAWYTRHMSEDTHIIFPVHIRSKHILCVVAKIMAVPHTIGAHRGGRIDPSRPAGLDNRWHIAFDDSHQQIGFVAVDSEITKTDSGISDLTFTDPAGGRHSWMFFPESDFEDRKVLLPNAGALPVAVGRRLVEFFGGQLQFRGARDDVVVDRSQALFPQRTHDQDVDERYFQFQNALAAVPRLSAQELVQGAADCAMRLTATEKNLRVRLAAMDVEELHAVVPATVLAGRVKIM